MALGGRSSWTPTSPCESGQQVEKNLPSAPLVAKQVVSGRAWTCYESQQPQSWAARLSLKTRNRLAQFFSSFHEANTGGHDEANAGIKFQAVGPTKPSRPSRTVSRTKIVTVRPRESRRAPFSRRLPVSPGTSSCGGTQAFGGHGGRCIVGHPSPGCPSNCPKPRGCLWFLNGASNTPALNPHANHS